jgi:Raf kinase inhibitor-like YbhB/YbcL family protein
LVLNNKGSLAMIGRILVFVVSVFLVCFSPDGDGASAQMLGSNKAGMGVVSPAFTEGSMIPKRYTCDGEDVSPSLQWTGIPEGAKTLSLICDDPDAPMGTWVHWVLFNIPVAMNGLPPGVPSKKILDHGAKHGRNDFGSLGYRGPCPPGGMHRYYFRLYAVDTEINLDSGITAPQLLRAMEGHVVAEGQLMGTYKR